MIPDTIGLLVAYLTPAMAPVPVATRVPNPRPVELIQVRRVGGPATEFLDHPRVDLFAWADTEPRATQLGSNARELVWALAGRSTLGPVVYRVAEFMGPTMIDDDETGTPKFWVTFELSVRADTLAHQAP